MQQKVVVADDTVHIHAINNCEHQIYLITSHAQLSAT